jgi:hypothetical protein
MSSIDRENDYLSVGRKYKGQDPLEAYNDFLERGWIGTYRLPFELINIINHDLRGLGVMLKQNKTLTMVQKKAIMTDYKNIQKTRDAWIPFIEKVGKKTYIVCEYVSSDFNYSEEQHWWFHEVHRSGNDSFLTTRCSSYNKEKYLKYLGGLSSHYDSSREAHKNGGFYNIANYHFITHPKIKSYYDISRYKKYNWFRHPHDDFLHLCPPFSAVGVCSDASQWAYHRDLNITGRISSVKLSDFGSDPKTGKMRFKFKVVWSNGVETEHSEKDWWSKKITPLTEKLKNKLSREGKLS